jgi:hypothetical protein
MSSPNIDDPNVMTAMIISDGIMKGFEGASDALRACVYRSENTMTALVASLARIKIVEFLLLKSAADTSQKDISFFDGVVSKVTTGVLLHNLVAGSLSMEEVRSLLGNEEKYLALLPFFEAALEKGKESGRANLQEAVQTLDSYMKQK